MFVRRALSLIITIATLFLAPVTQAAAATTSALPPAKFGAALDSLVAAESRVRWEAAPPESALARARREGKPVFLDFWASWCMPCRWMDRAVYNDPLLGEFSQRVAMVRVDVDRPEGRALANRYDVHLYPTLVYLAPDGRETLRWSGPLGLRDTRLNLGQMAFPAEERASIEAQRARRPAHALYWFGARGEVERVRAIHDSLQTLPQPPGEHAIFTLYLGFAEEIAGRREKALAAYRRSLSQDSVGVHVWRAWLGVSVALEQAGDREGAEHAAREVLRLHSEPWLEARAARLALAATAPPLVPPPGIEAP